MQNARLLISTLLALLVGCATPRLLPREPLAEMPAAAPSGAREYDTDRNGSPDFSEFIDNGRITAIAFGDSNAARIQLATVRTAKTPHLLFILDSVPYELVRAAWNAGRFRYFHAPATIISVFPAMTDPAIAEFFHVSPCAGVESVHYDGRRLLIGLGAYLDEANAPWFKCVDYHLPPSDHVFAYLMPGTTFRRELAEAQSQLSVFARDGQAASGFDPKSKIQNPKSGLNSPSIAREEFVAYSVATSGLGSADGRAGHEYALEMLDRYCRQLVFDRRGDVHITLMSDHGHDFTPHHRIDIAAALKKLGYRAAATLETPNDVVIPAFGLVSCVAIHTHSPEKVARDCLAIPGVEFAMFRSVAEMPPPANLQSKIQDPKTKMDVSAVSVLSRECSARIARRDHRYRYEPVSGDPLRLLPLLANLPADPDGFVDDAALFAATADHEFPDPLDRIWHSFNGLFTNTPDVLLSLENNAYAGSADLAVWLDMLGVHGNLRRDSTSGFLMTTLHELPPVLRMRDARAALRGEVKKATAQSR